MTRTSAALLVFLGAGFAAADEPAAVTEDDTGQRTPLHTVVPVYPESARRDRLEGRVQVCFHVDRRGRPYRIAVRKSTHRVFERPSIAAIRASSYVALAADAEVPAIKTCRSFYFTLTPVEAPASSESRRSAASGSVVPKLTSPSSCPAMTASPRDGNAVSRQSRSNSLAMAGVP
jgi:TonB family protein